MATVILGSVFALKDDKFNAVPAVICLLFTVLAQISSNFVNDYYDFKKGTDREDRVGPQRAVASGQITEKAMLWDTMKTISIALLLGLLLLAYGGWYLIFV